MGTALGVAWAKPLLQSGTSEDESAHDGQTGTASYYSEMAHGERTASGEIFDKNAMVAAHPSLPFGTVVKVTDLNNGRSVEVRIIDRGPSRALQEKGVVIILSTAAAKALDFINQGTTQVQLDIVKSPDSGG